jgi:hypothetical protein
LLAGRIFDDRGNRMTPSHVRKRGIKYRYYLSSALLQGQPERAGGVSRIPAAKIEGVVVRSVRDHLNQSEEIEDAVLIATHIAKIEVQSDQLVIELTNAKSIGSKRSRSRNMLKVPWHKMPLRRRREIFVLRSPLPGNGISWPEKNVPIRPPNQRSAVSEIKWSYKKPANSGPFSTTTGNLRNCARELCHGTAISTTWIVKLP